MVNLAGQTGVIESNRKPNYCIEQNIIGFSNILNIVAQSKKKMTVINASTAGALYGDTKKICSENDEKKPLSYYGLTKFFNEQLSELFFKLYNVKIINLRFANVYGEYSLHKKSLIHTSIKNCIRKKTTEIFGNGYQTRDFIYVQDLIKIITKSFKLNYGSYNLATGESKSVNQIISKFKKISPNMNFKKTKKNNTEVKDVKINNKKIRKVLKINNNFFTKIDEGILKTYKWYKN